MCSPERRGGKGSEIEYSRVSLPQRDALSSPSASGLLNYVALISSTDHHRILVSPVTFDLVVITQRREPCSERRLCPQAPANSTFVSIPDESGEGNKLTAAGRAGCEFSHTHLDIKTMLVSPPFVSSLAHSSALPLTPPFHLLRAFEPPRSWGKRTSQSTHFSSLGDLVHYARNVTSASPPTSPDPSQSYPDLPVSRTRTESEITKSVFHTWLQLLSQLFEGMQRAESVPLVETVRLEAHDSVGRLFEEERGMREKDERAKERGGSTPTVGLLILKVVLWGTCHGLVGVRWEDASRRNRCEQGRKEKESEGGPHPH